MGVLQEGAVGSRKIFLEVGGKGAGGFRIIRNVWVCHHFHAYGRGWEGGDWLQNHKKRIGLSSFSWFWKWVAGFRTIKNAKDCHHFHVFGSGWEAGDGLQNLGRGAIGFRNIRNA